MKEKTFNKLFNVFLIAGVATCVTIACVLNIIDPQNTVSPVLQIISAFGAVMGITSTVLAANGSIFTFLFGLCDVLIFTYTLFDQKLPATLVLYLFYVIPMEFIGFYKWRKKGASASAKVTAQHLAGKKWIKYGLLFLGIYAAVFAFSPLVSKLAASLDPSWASHPAPLAKTLFDCAVTTCNIVAMLMMAQAYVEQWYIWVIVNITYICLWSFMFMSGKESNYTIMQLIKYIFYLLNALNAIRIWRQLSRVESPES